MVMVRVGIMVTVRWGTAILWMEEYMIRGVCSTALAEVCAQLSVILVHFTSIGLLQGLESRQSIQIMGIYA